MKVGTKSVLFGAHQFILRPLFVAAAWWKLYGFPWDPRLWVAFFVHDLGYWGKPNMDGPEGERHVEFGARVMRFLFDWYTRCHHERFSRCSFHFIPSLDASCFTLDAYPNLSLQLTCFRRRFTWLVEWDHMHRVQSQWYCLCLYHSRFRAMQDGWPVSRLCCADKFSVCLEPAWLYLPRVRLSGEIHEYMKLAVEKYSTMNLRTTSQSKWFADVQRYLRGWVAEHKDGRPDTWTPAAGKQAATESGVWK